MDNKNIERMREGIRKMINNKVLLIVPIALTALIYVLSIYGFDFMLSLGVLYETKVMRYIYICSIILLWIVGMLTVMILMGTPLKSKKVEQGMLDIGLKDKSREVPALLSITRKRKMLVYEFYSPRLSVGEFEKKRTEIEAVLNKKIIGIKNGRDMQHIRVEAVNPNVDKNKVLLWNDNLLDERDFIIKVGESYTGVESFDLANPPHWLIAGGSGSGKSNLLKLILMQCIKKGAEIYLADFKGGVDYSQAWHKLCSIITEASVLLDQLDQILGNMEERRKLFVEVGTTNIAEYNEETGRKLKRIVFACDEIAEVLDKTGLDKEEKNVVSQIESKISTIARQGRAFGIHLIFATQRPDADILKGQIKNNIGLRICGKADKVLSQIILDNTDAADQIAPDDQGMFLTNMRTVFKAYLVDDNCLEVVDNAKTRDQG